MSAPVRLLVRVDGVPTDDARRFLTALERDAPPLADVQRVTSTQADPTGRRFGYPFTNCTNRGPRFTIVRDVPDDRPLTTMADFPCAFPAPPSTTTRPTEDSTPSRHAAQPAAHK
ncbi:MAG TPA: hypothetical protein VFX16_24155 [Pseudonocardiaceae bacterium]|nr:hypothetical protein [Pseudonocardiaceae bacterium]